MPCTIQFVATVKKKPASASLTICVDADGSGDFDAAERFAMFDAGAGAHSRLVQIAAPSPKGTPFVLLVNANPGAAISLSALDASGAVIFTHGGSVTVPATGRTWIAGHI